jgi:type VI secretion system protein ImpM
VTSSPIEVGFYGKLPCHGDFLRRRASDAFVEAWDAWLQACMSASRDALGDRWLDVYLTSPAWRFVCAAGACGPVPVIGLMVPSVDRVGRYFPLTVVADLPADVALLVAATELSPFFESAERLVVDTLATEEVDFGRFDDRVISLGDELAAILQPRPVVLEAAAAVMLNDDASNGWHLPIASSGQLGATFEQLLSLRLSAMYDPLVLWWTEGSANVEPSCLVVAGLPPPETFGALLDGTWAQHGWHAVPALVTRRPAGEPSDEPVVDVAVALRVRSAAATDVGKVRSTNQDAFVERPEICLWGVADGLGGHRDGQIASREVCDALADLVPAATLDQTVDAATERLQQVNEHLLRSSARAASAMTDRSGSTVVSLLLRGDECAILWAGDSRAYRWRAGRLERLTRDHSVAESEPEVFDPDTYPSQAGRPESHAVTRAVGVQTPLAIDVHRDHVQAGDWFLLCSDGLTHTLSDDAIRMLLESTNDVQGAVDGLIQATLAAGAPDNVTVLIVETFA